MVRCSSILFPCSIANLFHPCPYKPEMLEVQSVALSTDIGMVAVRAQTPACVHTFLLLRVLPCRRHQKLMG